MAENQLNVNVSFEGELAKYLKDIAEQDCRRSFSKSSKGSIRGRYRTVKNC
ncbi:MULTISPECIES: hypothetical protein [unclassified Wolbachia]|uniref:hypothetical protein n=1 Tax=unclassified Wolbachia TaxID=2640676 RepID=UPI001FD422E4|nr:MULTISPECIES: hypothetical protein [unclassified Wolbachia]